MKLCTPGVIFALALTTSGQQPPPTFRAGVDLLTVEAVVLDRDGRPVRDLQPSDFSVTVGGAPRKVLFARFYGSESTSAATLSTTPPTVTAGDLPGNAGTVGGRIVVFVVDRDSIKTGNEKTILETARTVLDALTPADAVGLIGLPVGSVELTREHERVRQALTMMTGTQPRQALIFDRTVTWEEALAYEQQNVRVIAEVVERECVPNPNVPGAPPDRCPDQLRNQAREMLQAGRAQVQTTTAVLARLADRLAPLRGPKHVVLLSGGMAFDQELLTYYNDFARKAVQAQIALYAVHLDQPASDSSDRRIVPSAFGGREMSQGLTTMTGMTGGAFFNGIGRAAGVFERIRVEMNNFYELGLETVAEDGDGKARDLSIQVNRSGLLVRARPQIALPDRTARSTDPLAALLQQPTDVAELPMAVTAYTTRGDDETRLRVLLSAEIGSANARPPADWAFTVLNEGNVVASGRQHIDQVSQAPWAITSSAKLVPGQYRVRYAASDANGKTAVVDVPLTVGLRAAGALQVSDLIVGTADAGKLQPRTRIVRGAPLSALIEFLSAAPDRLSKTRAVIEIIPAGSAEPVQRFLMAARTGSADTMLLNGAEIDTSALAPGRYTASVIALVDNQPAGRFVRVFDVVASGTR